MDATRGVLFRESLAWKLTSTTSTICLLTQSKLVRLPVTKIDLSVSALVAVVHVIRA